ncbi:MAG: TIGR03016 family PEP-CTERM system-associated outer membrane protein [Gammaproteobacteria bacterium]|nr:TIGR03016 family PEP-CTERM system-associated outer membrane protein [Gammaproteobacteria bacterium]
MSARTFPLLFVLMLVSSFSVDAATWRTDLGLSASTIYSDNVDLTSVDKQGGWSARITPRIGLTGEGRRLKLDFFYTPSFLYRFYDGGENRWTNNLSTSLWSELYKDFFFIEARADARRDFINPLGATGDDVNETDNTTQTVTTSISPYIQTRLSSYADVRVGYTYSRVWFDENRLSGSDGHRADFSLTSGQRFQVIDWTVTGDFQRVEYSRGDHSVFAKFLTRVGYRVSNHWRINGYLGYDDNNFLTLADAANEPESDGTAYGLGATWNPSPRTNLDFAYGHRFFGDNFYFDFRHQARRSVFTASLSHEPYNARNELLNRDTFQRVDAFGNPISYPSGEEVLIDPDTPALTTEDYVRRQLNVGYVLQNKRGSAGLSGYYTVREYFDEREDIDTYGLTGSVSHALGNRIRSSTSLSWRRWELENEDGRDTEWLLNLGLTRPLSRRTNVSLNYLYRDRSSDDPINKYTENRISLSLSSSW